jgi:hypothetical protein
MERRLENRPVNLRGFEALTICMPRRTISSHGVALGPVTADQSLFHVGLRLARSGGIWARWQLVWFCFSDLPSNWRPGHGGPSGQRHDGAGDRRPRRGDCSVQGARRAVGGSGARIVFTCCTDRRGNVTDTGPERRMVALTGRPSLPARTGATLHPWAQNHEIIVS